MTYTSFSKIASVVGAGLVKQAAPREVLSTQAVAPKPDAAPAPAPASAPKPAVAPATPKTTPADPAAGMPWQSRDVGTNLGLSTPKPTMVRTAAPRPASAVAATPAPAPAPAPAPKPAPAAAPAQSAKSAPATTAKPKQAPVWDNQMNQYVTNRKQIEAQYGRNSTQWADNQKQLNDHYRGLMAAKGGKGPTMAAAPAPKPVPARVPTQSTAVTNQSGAGAAQGLNTSLAIGIQTPAVKPIATSQNMKALYGSGFPTGTTPKQDQLAMAQGGVASASGTPPEKAPATSAPAVATAPAPKPAVPTTQPTATPAAPTTGAPAEQALAKRMENANIKTKNPGIASAMLRSRERRAGK